MVQIEEIKEDNALPIDALINISEEEINKLKEIKMLFNNRTGKIRRTLVSCAYRAPKVASRGTK